MAKVIRRVWTSRGPTGRRVKHVAWGYQIAFIGADGKGHRERRFSREWLSEQDALAALVARQREIEAGQVQRPQQRTLGQVVDEYLAHKANEKKRSVDDDELILKRKILRAFGAETPLRKITREDIARFTKARLEEEVRPGHKVKPGTVANELSVFRHLLRLAQEWGYLANVPKVKLPKRSEGRFRYLQSDEIARLLEACPESRNPHLGAIVVIALNTGMRRGEILGLEWDRVDLATARIHSLPHQVWQAAGHPDQHGRVRCPDRSRAGSQAAAGAPVQEGRRRRLGPGPYRVRVGAPAGEHPGLHVPRPPAHFCVPCRDAGRVPGRAEGAARAFDPDDDPPIRPPVSDPPSGGRRSTRRLDLSPHRRAKGT